ncbi:putative ATP-dependent DEAD/DEAH box RNA-helicase [Moraxella macacae 0408225]|uniref:Putative ATP-dependent DEAD/DEAH box RNA-helicase n=1 Tax=Moraxella macacae 0408225 TaxID=1230338 RepID=L2F5V7_9GAMM|nr:DEAD/DEAH box helicase [Moraxella macacae]ELA08417.1 putative ATP-dependent DEAD/DEAH box RNA-helicase [Moraxella macacae 0408225]
MTSIDRFLTTAHQNHQPTDSFNPQLSEILQPLNPLDNTNLDNTNKENSDNLGFADLGLSNILLKSIEKTGYTTPTPIQAKAIPVAIEGRDLLLSAQTGSGKTAAFVLPILHQLSNTPAIKTKQHKSKAVKALILTPTRELAHQVSDSIRRYGSSMRDLFSVPLVGGSAYGGQIRALKKGVQIIIATPGRLLDHISAGRVDLSDLSMLVLDEADRMLDMGFADDINAILDATPSSRQTIMSSATWDGAVGKIAESFTENPERISIKVETAHIDEKVYFCDNFDHKNKLLEHLICDNERSQAIIFTATKRSSEELAERLQEWGHKVCYLHGDLPQGKRNRIVADLRSGKYQLVVATDVAARGIDLPNISHVFNYDLPRQVEDYVHRIGRSGRAGRTGIAINLCSRDDRRQLGNINRYLKRDMSEAVVEGLEPKFIERHDRDAKKGRSKGRFGKKADFSGREKSFDRKPKFDNSERSFDKRSVDKKTRFARDDRYENKKTENSKKFADFDKQPRKFGQDFNNSLSSNSPNYENRDKPSNRRQAESRFNNTKRNSQSFAKKDNQDSHKSFDKNSKKFAKKGADKNSIDKKSNFESHKAKNTKTDLYRSSTKRRRSHD